MTKNEAVEAARSQRDVVTNEGDVGEIAQIRMFDGKWHACLVDDQYSWYPVEDIEIYQYA